MHWKNLLTWGTFALKHSEQYESVTLNANLLLADLPTLKGSMFKLSDSIVVILAILSVENFKMCKPFYNSTLKSKMKKESSIL